MQEVDQFTVHEGLEIRYSVWKLFIFSCTKPALVIHICCCISWENCAGQICKRNHVPYSQTWNLWKLFLQNLGVAVALCNCCPYHNRFTENSWTQFDFIKFTIFTTLSNIILSVFGKSHISHSDPCIFYTDINTLFPSEIFAITYRSLRLKISASIVWMELNKCWLCSTLE
jgi:hypothetical protein